MNRYLIHFKAKYKNLTTSIIHYFKESLHIIETFSNESLALVFEFFLNLVLFSMNLRDVKIISSENTYLVFS